MKRETEAWRDKALFETGMGQVVIARFKANGDAEVGFFLVDIYALGVKDAFFRRFSAEEYDEAFRRMFPDAPVAMKPAAARALVEGAVAYARNCGLEPHPDYRLGQRVFGGIDASECQETFTFGKDGKPLYFQGPHDSPERVRQIMACLERHCGRGNYDSAVLAEGPPDAE
jgi:hypothetical protein